MFDEADNGIQLWYLPFEKEAIAVSGDFSADLFLIDKLINISYNMANIY